MTGVLAAALSFVRGLEQECLEHYHGELATGVTFQHWCVWIRRRGRQ
jgi:hypothetical protein